MQIPGSLDFGERGRDPLFVGHFGKGGVAEDHCALEAASDRGQVGARRQRTLERCEVCDVTDWAFDGDALGVESLHHFLRLFAIRAGSREEDKVSGASLAKPVCNGTA